jgi:DNA-binding transcriptional LysR family regulator
VSLPALALVTTPFAAIHSRTRYQIISQTSFEIQRDLDDFKIDVAVTYLDNEALSHVRTVPLYRERYVLITREVSGFSGLRSISWAKAATLPLCLLTPSMQNRRIIDAQFRAAGAEANAVVETNSLVTLWTHLLFGQLSTVVPQTFLLLFEQRRGLISIPLVEPETSLKEGCRAIRDDVHRITAPILANWGFPSNSVWCLPLYNSSVTRISGNRLRQ